MDKAENGKKQEKIEDRVWGSYTQKLSGIHSSSSRLFYGTIIFLNLFTMLIAFFILNTKGNVEKFSIIFENMGIKNILLLLMVFVGIMILKTLPDYLKVFSKTKKRKFFYCYVSNIAREYGDCVTIFKKGGLLQSEVLVNSKINTTNALSVSTSKSIINRVSFLIYSGIFMLIGAFSWVKYIPIYLYLLALIVFVFNVAFICFVFYFGKNKESAVAFIASICKFLYNKKIIKDYEKVFYSIVDTLILYNKAFKYNKIIVWTEIFANILIYFLKGLAIYLLCYSINLINGINIFNVLFVWTVLELLLSAWPLQKGTLIFELLFILMCRVYFFEGYILGAIVIFRVFDYFIYVVQYVLYVLIAKIFKKEQKNGAMQR